MYVNIVNNHVVIDMDLFLSNDDGDDDNDGSDGNNKEGVGGLWIGKSIRVVSR